MSAQINYGSILCNNIFEKFSHFLISFITDIFYCSNRFPISRIKTTHKRQWDIQTFYEISKRKNMFFKRKMTAILTIGNNRVMPGNQYIFSWVIIYYILKFLFEIVCCRDFTISVGRFRFIVRMIPPLCI